MKRLSPWGPACIWGAFAISYLLTIGTLGGARLQAETAGREVVPSPALRTQRGSLLRHAAIQLAQAKQKKSDQAQAKKPNILFIMGDDIGWFQIGAYHQGIMSGKTPNLDRLAAMG